MLPTMTPSEFRVSNEEGGADRAQSASLLALAGLFQPFSCPAALSELYDGRIRTGARHVLGLRNAALFLRRDRNTRRAVPRRAAGGAAAGSPGDPRRPSALGRAARTPARHGRNGA